MSVQTPADDCLARAAQHVADARASIAQARREVFAVLTDDTMWGARDFRDGHVRGLFTKLDDLEQKLEAYK